MRALYNPFFHGSGRHIRSEVWVSFALGSLDHYLYHHSRHTVTCFDLAFMWWVVRHYHTLLHFYPSLFHHFLLHPFIIRLIPFCLLLPSSIVVSLHEQLVLWCTSPVVGQCSFGCRVESPYSHSPPIFDIAHTEAWHYLLGNLGLCFPSFHSPFTPSLHYGPSRKTTLRPWDLVSASTRFIRTGSVYWLSMGCRQVSIVSGDIEGHILPFHSVCLPQVHD